ncbi:MAG TPA: SCP2 sterol-binding domain-containing protein [Thermoleophilaceae bacterium]|nr:SCP2 sterol-binding domain-containing protein [Thermoleophilaceae bacterium]
MHFKDERDVYAFIGTLLQDLAADPELAPKFRQANTTVQFQTHDPEAQITIDLSPDREMRVDLGPTDLEPEVVMASDADTAHGFWLGKVDVIAALSRGQIKARGPVAKVLRLVPLLQPAFDRYEQMLRDAGRLDLLEAA